MLLSLPALGWFLHPPGFLLFLVFSVLIGLEIVLCRLTGIFFLRASRVSCSFYNPCDLTAHDLLISLSTHVPFFQAFHCQLLFECEPALQSWCTAIFYRLQTCEMLRYTSESRITLGTAHERCDLDCTPNSEDAVATACMVYMADLADHTKHCLC